MNDKLFPALLLTAALTLATPGSALAQDSQGNLTAQGAVELAVKHNPTLHVALLQTEQARYAVLAEEAIFDPIFSANATIARNRNPSLRGTEGTVVTTSNTASLGAGLSKTFALGTLVSANVTGQRTVSYSPPINNPGGDNATGPAYRLVGTLALTQPLLRGAGSGIGLASLRVARLNRTATNIAAQQTSSQTLHDMLYQYWELWYATESVRIVAASRDLAQALKDQANEQVKSGTLAPVDALPFATQVAEQEQSLVERQTTETQNALGLALALGQADRTGAALRAADTPTDVGNDDLSAQAINEALTASYALKQLQANLQVAQDNARYAGDALRPALNLNAQVSAQGLGNRSVPPAFEQFGRGEAVSAQVGLTFETPVTNTRREALVQSSLLSAHIIEKQIESTRQAIRTDVQSALAKRNAARVRLEVALETEKVAGQQAEGQRGKFTAGTALAIEVQKADDSLRQAQLSVQRARVDLVEGELDLLHLRGKLLDRYADVLKRLTPNVLTLDDAREPM